RHVKLPKLISRWLPHFSLLSEPEWRALGVEQSSNWEHYMIHAPEPHILLFRQ
ncbi:cyclin-dependent kinases regulatory subunit, partial [Dichotomocladium elegans]